MATALQSSEKNKRTTKKILHKVLQRAKGRLKNVQINYYKTKKEYGVNDC